MLTQDDLDTITDIVRHELFRAFVGEVSSCSSGLNAGRGHAGETLENVLRAQHYGFTSSAPDQTEAVYLETEAGLVNVAERSGSAPSVTGGQVALYDANGAIVKLLNASSGRRIELGAGGTVRDVAYANAAAANASLTSANTTMAAWISAVQAALVLLNVAPHPITVPTAPSDFGFVSSGSAKVGVEP